MTAGSLTLSGGECNHLSIQRHIADVQSNNELGCDISCHILARSRTGVEISGWDVQ